MYYFSDSGGSDLNQKLKKIDFNFFEKPIQILIHPIWWTNLSSSPTETLKKWIAEFNLFIINETKFNCKTFQP